MDNRNGQTPETSLLAPTYKTSNIYPGIPSTTIYLHGLLGLCFNHENNCTVGVNSRATHHSLTFDIFKKPGCVNLIPGGLPPFTDAYITVKNGSGDINNTLVYNGDNIKISGSNEKRHSCTEYWVDMEDVYGVSLTPKSGVFTPRFHINNALFCAYRLTTAKHQLSNDTGTVSKPERRLALVLAADIFLGSGQHIEIKTNTSSTPLILPAADQHEIHIINACTKFGSCDFDPLSAKREERNDFYWYYDTLASPPGTELLLFNREPRRGPDGPAHLRLCRPKRPFFGDRAPCMPVGFGSTTAFPI